MDIRRVVGENIRFIREKRKLSQEALAAKAEISISYMGYIERGEKAITIIILERVAKVLKVSPGLLLDRDAHRKV